VALLEEEKEVNHMNLVVSFRKGIRELGKRKISSSCPLSCLHALDQAFNGDDPKISPKRKIPGYVSSGRIHFRV